jgi:general stress protein 26
MSTTTNDTDATAKIWDLIHDIHVAMLTTTDSSGSLYSRPMATQQDSFHGKLSFLTQQYSGKVAEVEDNAQVNLTYVDPHQSTFVSLSGTASLSRDRARIDQLWHASFTAWFPGGKDDPEIAVLTVRVQEAEYWDAPSNSLVRNFQILKRAVTGGKSSVGEHERLSVTPRAS